jgi:YidC/Oxa1 family membrane protein insertase
MDKKAFVGFGLLAALWIGWILYTNKTQPQKPETDYAPVRQDDKKNFQKDAPKTGISVKIQQSKTEEKTITYKNSSYDIVFSNKGAAIKSIRQLDRNIQLSVPDNSLNARGTLDFAIHFNDDELLNGNMLDTICWNAVESNEGRIKFAASFDVNGKPVTIEKKYDFTAKGNQFRVAYTVKNTGRETIVFNKNSIIVSQGDLIGPSLDFENTYNLQSSVYYKDGSFSKMQKGGGGSFLGCFTGSKDEPIKKEHGQISWAGIMGRYFVLIMIPQNFKADGVVYDNRNKSGARTGLYWNLGELRPGASGDASFKIYLGEKDKVKLAEVDKSLVDAADVTSWIEPIRILVMWCLLWINKFIGNFGWSLVVFSIITKIIFMPLTKKSTESMKKMQQLTPYLNEIKEKYKDRPQEYQAEMFKLYKEKKINPLGGCLPMLMQMPFFIALYSALSDSIDLWQAPFIFWINDLSMPDTVARLWGYNVNILPLIMTVTTFVQQKLSTTAAADKQQQMMLMMMPVMMIFIFWNMPSGLVLYWSLQNIFQIIHQGAVSIWAKRGGKTASA